ncbi:nucleoside hydrolase [Paenibacillus sp.]|uniref:nucleoside hydrolase n=1 Tax=Paenibacillus sp. TaxID=58172 RepID=UPI002D275D12|nr:nucleoside hydrolase [Paenibacillus sp.]HZG86587.1 nucleoside hydrolase [Paenibacillus sp.]
MTAASLPVSADALIRKLQHPARKIRMVLDTDTFNEIDDQFAVVYALTSPDAVEVEALYAAPFFNELSSGPADGMEKSYQEILRILGLLGRTDVPAYRGSTSYLPKEGGGFVDSDAARNIVQRAMASDPTNPLYVVAIGAITNIASALRMEPAIADRIVIVWLGGHSFQWPNTKEFNLYQDIPAARTVFDSGAPVVLVPCMGVASHLQTSLSEIRDYVKDAGPIGEYLYGTYRNCAKDHFAYTRVIWDIATIAWLVDPSWAPSIVAPSPRVSDDGRWIPDPTRHPIRYVYHLHRDPIFRDLFQKIATAGGG